MTRNYDEAPENPPPEPNENYLFAPLIVALIVIFILREGPTILNSIQESSNYHCDLSADVNYSDMLVQQADPIFLNSPELRMETNSLYNIVYTSDLRCDSEGRIVTHLSITPQVGKLLPDGSSELDVTVANLKFWKLVKSVILTVTQDKSEETETVYIYAKREEIDTGIPTSLSLTSSSENGNLINTAVLNFPIYSSTISSDGKVDIQILVDPNLADSVSVNFNFKPEFRALMNKVATNIYANDGPIIRELGGARFSISPEMLENLPYNKEP